MIKVLLYCFGLIVCFALGSVLAVSTQLGAMIGNMGPTTQVVKADLVDTYSESPNQTQIYSTPRGVRKVPGELVYDADTNQPLNVFKSCFQRDLVKAKITTYSDFGMWRSRVARTGLIRGVQYKKLVLHLKKNGVTSCNNQGHDF